MPFLFLFLGLLSAFSRFWRVLGPFLGPKKLSDPFIGLLGRFLAKFELGRAFAAVRTKFWQLFFGLLGLFGNFGSLSRMIVGVCRENLSAYREFFCRDILGACLEHC